MLEHAANVRMPLGSRVRGVLPPLVTFAPGERLVRVPNARLTDAATLS
jgi:hypothetical protein